MNPEKFTIYDYLLFFVISVGIITYELIKIYKKERAEKAALQKELDDFDKEMKKPKE